MRNNKKQAFTMVELLIVLVILGILFVVLMANVDFTTEEAKSTGAMNMLRSYQTAAKTVGLQYTGFTNDMTELVYQLNKKLDPELQVFLVGNEIHTNAEDPWGTTIKIEYSEPVDSKGQIKFASAGADTVFDTGDDIITLLRCNMENEIVIENPVNDPNHTHEYTQEVAGREFIYSEANCQQVAKYYRSCICGAKGDTTFEAGSKNFDKHAATIDAFVPYDEESHKFTRTCSACASVIQQSYELHQVEDGVQCVLCGDLTHRHDYTRELQLPEYKKNDATCSAPLTYFKSCSCGQKGTETFTVGTARTHDFSKRTLDYFVSGATCASPAKYYLTCTYCDAKGTETYAYGNRDESNHVGETTIQYVNIDDTKHTKKIICMGCGFSKSETTENHFEGCGCHTHQYTEEIVMTDYLKTAATCTGKAVYYTSCNCGRSSQDTADEDTFETGAVLGHAPASTPTWNSDHSIATVKCTRVGCTQKWSNSSTKNVSVNPTCTKEEKFSHDVTINVNGTNKSFNCGITHTGSKALSNHTGTLTYPEGGGSANVHQIYSCCKATANANHSYGAATCTTKPKCACGYESGSVLGHSPATTATWDTNHTKATVKCTRSGCSQIWSSTSVSETTTRTATCILIRQYKHTTTFSVNGSSKTYTCTTTHEGGLNASNHSGTETKGGLASVHSKWSCCGLTISSTHSLSDATCTKPRTCSCGYTTGSALGHGPQNVATWNANHTEATVACGRSGCTQTWSSSSVSESDIVIGTCKVNRTYEHSTTFSVNGTNKTFSCGSQHTGSKNPTNHTGTLVYPPAGGKSDVHQIYNCCEATANANHSYAGASCTSPQTCACGYTTGSALGHSPATTATWDTNHTKATVKCTRTGCSQTWSSTSVSSVVTTTATCVTAEGTIHRTTFSVNGTNKTFECSGHTGSKNASNHSGAGCTIINGGTSSVHQKYSKCGATYSTTHSYTKTTQASATCTVKGTSKYTCSCGYSYTSQDIPVISHTTTYGGTASVHTKCSVCGTTLSSTHSYTTTESGGIRTYSCGCGYSYSETYCTSHYDSSPSYSWNSNHTACSASGTCDTCGTAISETGDVRHNNYKAATCMYGRQSDYKAFFNQFPDQVCSGWHNDDGNKNPDNHDSSYCSLNGCTRTCGAVSHNAVYGGTASVHTKCSKCSTTISSTHSYSTTTSGSGCTAITTKTCACGYTTNTQPGSHNFSSVTKIAESSNHSVLTVSGTCTNCSATQSTQYAASKSYTGVTYCIGKQYDYRVVVTASDFPGISNTTISCSGWHYDSSETNANRHVNSASTNGVWECCGAHDLVTWTKYNTTQTATGGTWTYPNTSSGIGYWINFDRSSGGFNNAIYTSYRISGTTAIGSGSWDPIIYSSDTPSDITSKIGSGAYRIENNTVLRLDECYRIDYTPSSSLDPNGKPYHDGTAYFDGTIVAKYVTTYSYSKGSSNLGTVSTNEGSLPSGSLYSGSYASGWCIMYENGSYYYYELN